MSTAPFAPDVAALLGSPVVTLEYAATAHPTGMDPFPLAVVGGRVSYSDKRAPRVTASLECAWPTEEAQRAALDPRTRCRVVLTVTYVLPNGTRDTHDVADLHLRERSLRRPDGLMGLTLASDEALVIDASMTNPPFGGDPDAPLFETKSNGPAWIATLLASSLAWIGGPDPVPVVTAPPRAADWPLAADYWDGIEDMADQLDVEVFDNGDRVLRVAPRATVAGDSVLTVKGGPGGILLDADTGVTRDDWANYVVLDYQWTKANGVREQVFGTARVMAGAFAVTAVGYKVIRETRDRATAQSTANRAAANILARLLARSRALRFTTVPAWWVRPGDTITYAPEAGPEQRHLVSEIEHDLAGMTMGVVTRLPDTDQTIGE